jgi:hypothetical protein
MTDDQTNRRGFRRLRLSRRAWTAAGLSLALVGTGLGGSFAAGAISSAAAVMPASGDNAAPPHMVTVTNDTPYTWTRTALTMSDGSTPEAPQAPETVAPKHTVSFTDENVILHGLYTGVTLTVDY